MRGDLPRISINSKKEKSAFFSPSDECILPAASTIKPEEREFCDELRSKHMVSKKDLNSSKYWKTVRVSESPTTVVTTNGEVLTRHEATIYVRELDLFVTIMFLEDTCAFLPLRKFCEDHGCNYQWTSGQKPHLIKNGKQELKW